MYIDFERANQLADRVRRGEDSGLHKELVSLCMPYCFYVRKKFGFHDISNDDVRNELVPSAVDLAMVIRDKTGKAFMLCLETTFRDCCRELRKIVRERSTYDLVALIDIVEPRTTVGLGRKQRSPVSEAEKKEERMAVWKELEKHEGLSKEVVIRRARGSTYEEMAASLNRTRDECRRNSWKNLNSMKKNLQDFYKEKDLLGR